jgi:hypothetical protein
LIEFIHPGGKSIVNWRGQGVLPLALRIHPELCALTAVDAERSTLSLVIGLARTDRHVAGLISAIEAITARPLKGHTSFTSDQFKLTNSLRVSKSRRQRPAVQAQDDVHIVEFDRL